MSIFSIFINRYFQAIFSNKSLPITYEESNKQRNFKILSTEVKGFLTGAIQPDQGTVYRCTTNQIVSPRCHRVKRYFPQSGWPDYTTVDTTVKKGNDLNERSRLRLQFAAIHPKNVPIYIMCRVWSTFQARSVGSLVKLRIQDLPQNRLKDAVELFVKYAVDEETFLKAAGIKRNPKAIAEYRSFMTESMKDPAFHNMICCEAEEENKIGKIVGLSSMALVTAGSNVSPFFNYQSKLETKEMQTCMKLEEASNLHEHMDRLHISNYYDDIGLIVHPRFRKLGIATEFFRARRLACLANNVAASGGMITSIGTDKIAKKDNWDTALEINLEELGKKHGVTFEDGAVSKLVIWQNLQFKPDGSK